MSRTPGLRARAWPPEALGMLTLTAHAAWSEGYRKEFGIRTKGWKLTLSRCVALDTFFLDNFFISKMGITSQAQNILSSV